MKRIILCLFVLTVFALNAKSQAHLGAFNLYTGYGDGSSIANDQPDVYLDGEYLRFSFPVRIPTDNLSSDSNIYLMLHGGVVGMEQTLYYLNFSYGTNIPYGYAVTYSGSYYVGNLPESSFELSFSADFPTLDNTIIGNSGIIGFTYYPN